MVHDLPTTSCSPDNQTTLAGMVTGLHAWIRLVTNTREGGLARIWLDSFVCLDAHALDFCFCFLLLHFPIILPVPSPFTITLCYSQPRDMPSDNNQARKQA